MRLLIGLTALVLVGSELWAMLAPESFYAAIATYPPFNRHFIHDIGALRQRCHPAQLAMRREQRLALPHARRSEHTKVVTLPRRLAS